MQLDMETNYSPRRRHKHRKTPNLNTEYTFTHESKTAAQGAMGERQGRSDESAPLKAFWNVLPSTSKERICRPLDGSSIAITIAFTKLCSSRVAIAAFECSDGKGGQWLRRAQERCRSAKVGCPRDNKIKDTILQYIFHVAFRPQCPLLVGVAKISKSKLPRSRTSLAHLFPRSLSFSSPRALRIEISGVCPLLPSKAVAHCLRPFV